MSLKHAILGWLSWRPASGYDLKKAIAGSGFQPWSGNNNQVYTTLLQLARDSLAETSTEHRDAGPTRKVYTITPLGRAELRAWLRLESEPPEWRNDFLTRLAWSAELPAGELAALAATYEESVRVALLAAGQADPRAPETPARNAEEGFVWDMIRENRRAQLEAELAWAGRLRNGLGTKHHCPLQRREAP